jgi:hypothetical protein
MRQTTRNPNRRRARARKGGGGGSPDKVDGEIVPRLCALDPVGDVRCGILIVQRIPSYPAKVRGPRPTQTVQLDVGVPGLCFLQAIERAVNQLSRASLVARHSDACEHVCLWCDRTPAAVHSRRSPPSRTTRTRGGTRSRLGHVRETIQIPRCCRHHLPAPCSMNGPASDVLTNAYAG